MNQRTIRPLVAVVAALSMSVAGVLAVTESAQAAPGDIVSFADPSLQACLNQTQFGAPADADITEAQMAGLIAVRCADRGITDLGGMQYATQLRFFDSSGNPVGDLSALSGLTTLTSVTLTDLATGDLNPLSGLTSLDTLSLQGANIADLSPISALTSLRSLTVEGTQVEDLSPLTPLTNLDYLYLPDNQVSDLAPVAGLPLLRTLQFPGNEVEDLSPIAAMTSLTWLLFTDNKVTDLQPVAGLVNLTGLVGDQNQIADLSPIAGLTALDLVSFASNHIVDLSPLRALDRVTSAYLEDQTLQQDPATVGVATPNVLRNVDGSTIPVTNTGLCAAAGCAELSYPAPGTDVETPWETDVSVGTATATFNGSLIRDVHARPTPPPADLSLSIDRTKVTAGTTLTVTGSGFTPGEPVRLELRPGLLDLGTVTARADGTISRSFAVPTDAALGVYTVVAAQGADTVQASFEVIASPTPTPTSGPRRSGTLAQTGADGVRGLWIAGVFLLGAGAALTLLHRRVRKAAR